jgi:hypothetical protein
MPATPRGNDIAVRAVDLVMRKAGLDYTLTNEPHERALVSLRAGRYDADILRLPQFDQIYPGALRVEPHLLTTTVHAFSRDPAPRPQGWAALKEQRVVHVLGAKVIELELPAEQPRAIAPNAEACLRMVALKRADVCLINAEFAYQPPSAAQGLQRRVLARVPLYIWVAPGRQALADQLARAVRATVASGELPRLAGADRAP